jgi:para-nitrobenzyl esterase
MSGSATMTQDSTRARLVADHVASLAGGPALERLGGLDIEAVLDLQSQAVQELAVSAGMMPFHPWVDGEIVPTAPLDAAARDELAPVPLVIGTTAHEMELFRSMVPSLPAAYAEPYLLGKAGPLGLTAAGVTAGFAACDGDLVTAIADVDLVLPSIAVARSHARRGLPVWRTRFSWEGPGHRACHAIDLPFHFGTLDVAGWRAFAGADGADAGSADRLSSRLRSAWSAFATTGCPACEPIGVWPVYDGSIGAIELGADVASGDDPDAGRWGSWAMNEHARTS